MNPELDYINMREFNRAFKQAMSNLYELKFAGGESFADAFDEFMEENITFVTRFTDYRKKYIITDWEAAAFMLALREVRR